jgi:hypothetical protein
MQVSNRTGSKTIDTYDFSTAKEFVEQQQQQNLNPADAERLIKDVNARCPKK